FVLPRLPVPLDQFRLAQTQPDLTGVPLWQASPLDLHADELRALRFAALVEPVGEDKSRGVVVLLRDDPVEEGPGLVGAHGSRSRMGFSRTATSATTPARSPGTSRPFDCRTKSRQRAADVFVPHHGRSKSARASADVS